MEKPPLALIAGPTASGKSALALKCARSRGGVVINADASQLYVDLGIVSARPPALDMAGVAHRLFGVLDGAEACTAARWAADARAEIAAAHEAGLLP
ncbi:MAG: isopentenyl transferase family protein, partial [Sandaracinobacteroides sp.]